MDIIMSDMQDFVTPVPGIVMKNEPIVIKRRTAGQLSHLDVLESESVHILREVAAECANPALLFSGGKDSIVFKGFFECPLWVVTSHSQISFWKNIFAKITCQYSIRKCYISL